MRTAFLVLTSTAVLVVPTSAVAAPVEITPTRPADYFSIRLATLGGSSSLTWNGPETFAVVPRGTRAPIDAWVRDGGRETTAFAGGGSVVRRAFAAGPDGYGAFDLVDPSLETLLAQARAGVIALTAGSIESRSIRRGTVALGPNDCAGYRAGTKTIDLDAQTLLPLKIVTRRAGARTQTIRLTGLRINPTLPAGTFRPLRPGPRAFRDDKGFRRTSPTVAAQNLPYVPKLPTALPAGFRLVVSGHAPRSGIVGPEASIPARPALFAAVYARGWEQIDVTQRRAVGGDWPGDPFGSECRPLTETAVTIGGLPATYAYGPETVPHLYWRDGGVLHAISGPFPAQDLVAVADSLTPVNP